MFLDCFCTCICGIYLVKHVPMGSIESDIFMGFMVNVCSLKYTKRMGSIESYIYIYHPMLY